MSFPKINLFRKKEKLSRQEVAERVLMTEIFDDMYVKRHRVYKVSFFKGLFFGLGTVLGGTVLIALLVWVLSLMVDIPGGIGDLVQNIVDTMQK